MKKLLAFIVFAFTLAFPVQSASAEGNFTITKVYVEQVKEEIWLSVYLAGQETSGETFKLILTQPQVPNSKFYNETLFENKWIKSVKYLPSTFESWSEPGNYQFTIQAVTKSGITSGTYSFSFNYSEPTWQQNSCDDLSELNAEWRDTWSFTDKFWQNQADNEIERQDNYNSYGCKNKLNWKIVNVKAKSFVWRYTVCADGWRSGSRGRGTCSWHGGVSHEMGYYKNVTVKRIQFYWIH